MLSVVFLMMAIPTAMRCYLIVVLICISLVARVIEHLFMDLLAIHTYLWEDVCSGPWPIFMMIILLLGYMGPLLDISPLLYIWFASIFFPFCRLSFHFVDGFFCNAEAFWLYRVPLVCFQFC